MFAGLIREQVGLSWGQVGLYIGGQVGLIGGQVGLDIGGQFGLIIWGTSWSRCACGTPVGKRLRQPCQNTTFPTRQPREVRPSLADLSAYEIRVRVGL